MRPLRAHLGSVQMVLLSPDGALNVVPFGALIDEHDQYLLEHFTFIYLSTGRDLLRLQVQGSPRQPPMIITDPDFGSVGAVGGFTPLPGTIAEARAIQSLLPEALVLSGTQATEAALKHVRGPRILHLATHGFFLHALPGGEQSLPERNFTAAGASVPPAEGFIRIPRSAHPLLRAGLVLAGVNQLQSGPEDGVLTALEAAGLDLWGTQLVVLSACETGLGDVHTGEGVYSLRRAVVLAGAESQVISLWKVDDEATKDLMVDYYRRLMAGEGRAEALRQAQLAMLHSRARNQPFYWASFISSGAWTSLAEKVQRQDSTGP